MLLLILRRSPRCFHAFLAFAFVGILIVPAATLRAQSFDATALHQPTDLGMTWLLKAGDDPAWARPDFDDSKWMIVDPNETLLRTFKVRPEVVWYRLHVKVAPNEIGLALREWNLSSAFEIYVNGQRMFQTGQVAPFAPATFDGILIKPIPDADIASGSVVIALRVHVSPLEWASGFPGLFAYNLTMGQEPALVNSAWLSVIGAGALDWFARVTGLGLGIVGLALFLAQRDRREYLWLFLAFFIHALALPVIFYRFFHNVPRAWEWLTELLWIAFITLMTLMVFALLRLRFGMWIRIILGFVIAGLLISDISNTYSSGSVLSTLLIQIPIDALFGVVIPVVLIVNLRRGNREAGILLIPFLLNALTIYLNLAFYVAFVIPSTAKTAFRWQTAIFNPTVGPFTLDLTSVASCLFVLSLGVIIVLRSTRMSRQQAMIDSELAAAREVQQIILPEQVESIPGFAIESAYEPAQQVGGDFFQILSAPEGSLLLVIGDVAGKGLPAAMLVSVLVGAIRGVTEYTSEPAELLANLNQRLVGRVAGSFSTALAARIFPDGAVVMANAGHLPPYLDARELESPGALPLGAKAGTRYETQRFQLPRGSRLTFYSDGIIEAQNRKGELFGFERGRELSMQPVKAIVEAAMLFGQQDDMTVIAVTRDSVSATARETSQAQELAKASPAFVI